MEVLEGQNILVTISGKKNRVRVYYLSWLKSKILRTDGLSDVSPSFQFFNFSVGFQHFFNKLSQIFLSDHTVFFVFLYSRWNDVMVGSMSAIYRVLYILK